jgi:4-amino-4-deoxy-L-arabinose transferase-like glycosyltransferase
MSLAPATDLGGNPRPAGLMWRCGLVASLGAVLLLVDRVATATSTTGGLLGRTFTHFDVGHAVIVVATSVAALTLWLPGSPHRASMSVRSWFLRGALVLYSLWTAAVIAAIAALHPTTGGRQVLTTLVFFRPVRGGGIIDGLGIGPLVLEMALIAAIAPFLARAVGNPAPRRFGPLRLEGFGVSGLLVVAGLAVRLLAIAADRRGPTGVLSTLPAELDLLGVGLGIATWITTGRSASSADTSLARSPRLPVPILAAGVAAVAFVVLAVTIRQPLVPGTESAVSLFVQAALGTLVAGGLVLALLTAAPGSWPRTTRWVAVLFPGLLLFHETAFVIIARQYVERVTETVLGVHLDGPGFPPFLWALVVSAAIGIVATAFVVQPLVLSITRRASANWFALTAGGVVALGFVWRVVALFTIAPARVDGGDPLFYHTTANVLAAGRGFPEPLHWIAYGQELKSAFHGPLFPLVLSFFSRLGGTAYLDHRMVAAMLGSLVVLGVLLVGRYLGDRVFGEGAFGGRSVGIIAGLIAAFYPNLWLIDGVLFPEGLMAALVVFTILCAYRWNDRPGWKLAAGLGALVALTALTRGEGIFLMVLLVLPLMIRRRSLATRQRWRQFGVACGACLIVLAPWMIRNIVTYKEFVPLSTNGNEVLVYANCDEAYNGKFIGFWYFDCQERVRQQFGEPPGDESQRAAAWRKIGIDYAKDHLGRLPEVIAARVGRQWELFRPWQNAEFAPIEGRNKNGARLGLFSYYALVAFGINGVRLLRKRRVALLPLTSQLISVTITAAAAYGTVRFRAPAEPVLCLLAAVGVAPLLSRLRRRAVLPASEPEPPVVDEDAFVLGGAAVRRRWSWPTVGGVGIVAFLTALPVRGMLHSTGGTMEEGFMLSFPERILKGAVPNVDFLHLYGPGALDVLAGWYTIFGVTLNAERAFGLLQHIAIIAGLYVVARAWGRGAACVTAGLSVFLIMTPIGLTAMAWNGGVALGLWSVIFAIRSRHVQTPKARRRMLIVAGLLAGLALTYRPDLALTLILTHGWLLWRRRRQWAPFAIGGGVGLLPLLIHVARIGPGLAIRTMLVDPVVKLRPGRELPRPPSWGHLDGALQAIAETVPPWWRFPALAPSHQLFIWFFALPVLALLVVGTGIVVHRRTHGSPRGVVLTAAGLFGLGLLPQAFQRPDSTHLTWVACVAWPLLVPTIIELVRMRVPRAHPRLRLAIGGGFLAALLFVVAPFFTYRTYLLYTRITVGNLPPAYQVHRGGRTFYMGDLPPARATQGVIDTLDRLSRPGERLLVGPVDLRRTWYSDTFFYYMFPELPPATQFMEMDPGIADAPGSPLADEVAGSDWVLLTAFWAGWREPNTAMNFGPDAPNEVVRSKFCLVQSFENDLVLLYHRCDEPLPDGATQAPPQDPPAS